MQPVRQSDVYVPSLLRFPVVRFCHILSSVGNGTRTILSGDGKKSMLQLDVQFLIDVLEVQCNCPLALEILFKLAVNGE